MVDLDNCHYEGGVVDDDDSRWFDTSLGEVLQNNALKKRVVKAFNTIAVEVLDISAELLRKSGAQIFVTSDDDEARALFADLAAGLGLDVVDLGPGKVAMKAAEALGDGIGYLFLTRDMESLLSRT